MCRTPLPVNPPPILRRQCEASVCYLQKASVSMSSISPMDLLRAYERSDRLRPAQAAQGGFSSALTAAQTSALSSDLDDIFQRAADTYGVPVALLRAIGKAESGFNPDAVSSAGAQGVMQLMPATARGLGVTDSFDPEQNIMGGAKYIAQKLQDYHGDIELALAAYNAGSGNVKKYGGVPPFKETKAYIQRVMGYMEDAGLRAASVSRSGGAQQSGPAGAGVADLSALFAAMEPGEDYEMLALRWRAELNMQMTAQLFDLRGGEDEKKTGLFSADLSAF